MHGERFCPCYVAMPVGKCDLPCDLSTEPAMAGQLKTSNLARGKFVLKLHMSH